MTSEDGQQQREARLVLTHVVEPGTESVGALVQQLGAVEVLQRLRAVPVALPGVSSGTVQVLEQRMQGIDQRVQRTLAHHHNMGVRFIAPGQPEWPTQLDDLGVARPLGLWVRGRADLRLWALQSVAVVGARACTDYGRSATRTLSADLAQQGWAVVSGAAYGIDAAAHQACLSVSGRTVAVLACGVDVVYPPGNADLLREIAHQGLVVSELPSGSRVFRSRFLQRNRVIAALTRGSVVVEAALRSGALNTAHHAGRLNRQVMAVPGSVHSAMSAGCHELIRTGAASLVTDVRDVLDLVGRLGVCDQPQRRGADLEPVSSAVHAGDERQLSSQHAQVYAALGVRVGRELNDLAVRTGLALPVLTAALGTLEAQGHICATSTGWRRLTSTA